MFVEQSVFPGQPQCLWSSRTRLRAKNLPPTRPDRSATNSPPMPPRGIRKPPTGAKTPGKSTKRTTDRALSDTQAAVAWVYGLRRVQIVLKDVPATSMRVTGSSQSPPPEDAALLCLRCVTPHAGTSASDGFGVLTSQPVTCNDVQVARSGGLNPPPVRPASPAGCTQSRIN